MRTLFLSFLFCKGDSKYILDVDNNDGMTVLVVHPKLCEKLCRPDLAITLRQNSWQKHLFANIYSTSYSVYYNQPNCWCICVWSSGPNIRTDFSSVSWLISSPFVFSGPVQGYPCILSSLFWYRCVFVTWKRILLLIWEFRFKIVCYSHVYYTFIRVFHQRHLRKKLWLVRNNSPELLNLQLFGLNEWNISRVFLINNFRGWR